MNCFGESSWLRIRKLIPDKSEIKCHARWLELTNKETSVVWTKEEDAKLTDLVQKIGHNWKEIAKSFPGRVKQQCRDRWLN